MSAPTRRTLNRAPSAALSSRIGDSLLRRRGERATAKEARSSELREPTPGKPVIVDIHPTETPLTDILEKARYEPRQPRTGDYLHVSDLLSKCVRKIAIYQRHEMPPAKQSLSLTDSLTFAQGDAIHDVIKSRVAQGGSRMAWGTWGCRCGTTKTLKPGLLSEVDQEVKCNACKGPRNVYEEVPMRDKELMIVGTPDLILYLPSYDAYYVTELKSIAHDRWKDLVRPDPDHVLQTLFYWFLMNRKGYRLSSRVSVLYATKGWMFTGAPYKEFTFDAPASLGRLTPYLEDARAVKSAREGGALPIRSCATEQAPEAKKCDVCKICFKGSEEASTKVDLRGALSNRLSRGK